MSSKMMGSFNEDKNKERISINIKQIKKKKLKLFGIDAFLVIIKTQTTIKNNRRSPILYPKLSPITAVGDGFQIKKVIIERI